MRNVIAFFSLLVLSACMGGAETIIQPVEYREASDLEFGEICVDSNVAAAPIVIMDRDHKIRIEASTYLCQPLEPKGYQVEFLDVADYTKKPPMADSLNLQEFKRIEVMGLYAP